MAGPGQYNPPNYLVTVTGLSREELVSQFEAFRQSLITTGTAPELAFERLLGNLGDAFGRSPARETTGQKEELERWQKEKASLQAELSRVTALVKQAEKLSLNSRMAKPAATNDPSTQVYLQFWFSTVTKFDGSMIQVHGAVTGTPIPFSLAQSWQNPNKLNSSAEHGFYDSRMDELIPTGHIRTPISRVIHFNQTHQNVPKVAVWLIGLSAAQNTRVSVKVTANAITETEFTIQIDHSGSTALSSVGVGWALWWDGGYQSSTTNVGSFSTKQAAISSASQYQKSLFDRNIEIPVLKANGTLSSKVSVEVGAFVALSSIDTVLDPRTWIKVYIKNISNMGYGNGGSSWAMEAGPASAKVYDLRVMYIK